MYIANRNPNRKQNLQNKIETFFSNSYLDIQGVNPGIPNIDEAYLARILTKIAVGSATVWWSVLEFKDFLNMRKAFTKSKGYNYEVSREDPF